VADITEKQFLELGDNYFKKLAENKADDFSIDLLKQLGRLNFADLNEFRLIEADYPVCYLFIEGNAEASVIWQKYTSIFNEADSLKRKDLLDRIKADLHKYIISVPTKGCCCTEAGKQSGIVYINKDQVASVYDKDTGFIRKDPVQYVF